MPPSTHERVSYIVWSMVLLVFIGRLKLTLEEGSFITTC